ncbi:symmetrical bis(5'-nucleosyl)-tetraphosphatase [Pseudomonadota bacterium AL_CKDN230030165-1A_HGKHYDSX7]
MKAPHAWVIGDVHGCHATLQALLAHPELAADREARLWFTGDLVNRGPASAATLRTVRALGDRAVVVLGNHDLRALGLACRAVAPGAQDRLDDLLEAPDAPELLDWLRQRPLAHAEGRYLLAHAGLYPRWDAAAVPLLAQEVEAVLRDARWRDGMASLLQRTPGTWIRHRRGRRRAAFIANALTRMRLCGPDGGLLFKATAMPGHWPPHARPWFDVPRRDADHPNTTVFGHWATLGLMLREDAICVDTACVTGGTLSALRLADRKLVQIRRIDGAHGGLAAA